MAGADFRLAEFSLNLMVSAMPPLRFRTVAHQPAHSSNPKPISFGICSRFVSAPSKLKSDANLFRLATSVLLMD
ncbi:hypothetical protein ROK90_05475 [Cronobacter dublinensis]|uniref:hypothetical protein n=1 Tax=Cronobacter dublinensis TaxID=413497 RepID=UPI002894ADE9|nr:hypothetical protein [Cronobacter dublinensis]ELY5948119.1 hypothetical protein [Cronobacter sakazakii]MDT3665466.1 hypothetical protein [Cronobacter dublinensis]